MENQKQSGQSQQKGSGKNNQAGRKGKGSQTASRTSEQQKSSQFGSKPLSKSDELNSTRHESII